SPRVDRGALAVCGRARLSLGALVGVRRAGSVSQGRGRISRIARTDRTRPGGMEGEIVKHAMRWLLLGAALLLQACALPGQRFDDDRYRHANAEEDARAGAYSLLRITPRVLRELAAASDTARPVANESLAEELRGY